jgi:hypothetical protein
VRSRAGTPPPAPVNELRSHVGRTGYFSLPDLTSRGNQRAAPAKPPLVELIYCLAVASELKAEPFECKRCQRLVLADPVMSHDMLEDMHWLCFHLEFEHPGDPDLPCTDTACHMWRLEVYEKKLRELGSEPEKVLVSAIQARFE